jgi:multiple sugar transport system substrate-binding protein
MGAPNRWLRSLAITVLVFLPLLGAFPPGSAPVAATQVTGEIEMLTWTAGPVPDQALQDLADLFAQTHPGATVNVTIFPYDEYAQKLPLLLGTGQPPDVFPIPADGLRLVQEGVVVPLDERLAADPVLSDPEQTRLWANDMSRLDGEHVYATQAGALCSMQLYYNRDLFDAAGVAYPTDDWTWDDFLAAAQQLTIKEGDRTTQWGAELGYLIGWDGGWQALAEANGADIIDTSFNPTEVRLDDPAVIASWQFMQDLVYTHQVAPPPAVSEALAEAGGPLLSGTVAMVPDGCWMLPNYKEADFNLGVALLPQGTEGRVSPVWWAGGGFGYMIPQASQNQDLAWEWLRWLAADPEANALIAGTGVGCGLPLVMAYDELYAEAWSDIPGGDACARSLDDAEFLQVFTPNWQEVQDTIIEPSWDRFMNGEISAQELSDAITGPINDELQ